MKYDLYPHLKLNHSVQLLKWKESIRKWSVTTLNQKTQAQEVELFDFVYDFNIHSKHSNTI